MNTWGKDKVSFVEGSLRAHCALYVLTVLSICMPGSQSARMGNPVCFSNERQRECVTLDGRVSGEEMEGAERGGNCNIL